MPDVPHPQLLPDGAVLAPYHSRDGIVMRRVEAGNAEHAKWVQQIQEYGTPESGPAPWGWIIVGLLIPILGALAAVILLAKGRGTHAAAVLTASAVGAWLALALLGY